MTTPKASWYPKEISNQGREFMTDLHEEMETREWLGRKHLISYTFTKEEWEQIDREAEERMKQEKIKYAIRTEQRFWEKVIKTGICWPRGGSLRKGYSTIHVEGSSKGAHVYAWEMREGPVPITEENLEVCHTCDVRNCVRNDYKGIYRVGGREFVKWGHLFVAPHRINMLDRNEKDGWWYQL